MANLRLMRYRQQFWGIFDCDETGRPIKHVPVFFGRDLRVVRAEFERLSAPPAPLPSADDEAKSEKAAKKKG